MFIWGMPHTVAFIHWFWLIFPPLSFMKLMVCMMFLLFVVITHNLRFCTSLVHASHLNCRYNGIWMANIKSNKEWNRSSNIASTIWCTSWQVFASLLCYSFQLVIYNCIYWWKCIVLSLGWLYRDDIHKRWSILCDCFVFLHVTLSLHIKLTFFF